MFHEPYHIAPLISKRQRRFVNILSQLISVGRPKPSLVPIIRAQENCSGPRPQFLCYGAVKLGMEVTKTSQHKGGLIGYSLYR